MRKTVLITGVAGQDGSYMADLCLELGYKVHGLARHTQSPNLGNLRHLIDGDTKFGSQFQLHLGDVMELDYLTLLVKNIRPDIIFNFAAQSHVQVSFEMPSQTIFINTIGFLNLINATLLSCPEAKIYQASSSELLGNASNNSVGELRFSPESPYAVSKLASHYISILYNKSQKLRITDGILFNHESYRRSSQFVTKKIIEGAVSISKALKGSVRANFPPRLLLGNVSARRDWGWAPEYMLGVLQHTLSDKQNTLKLGTGKSVTVLDFAERAFLNFGLVAEEWISFDSNLLRINDVNNLEANADDVHNSLGWNPQIDWKILCDLMCEELMSGKEKEVNWKQLISERKLTFE